MGDDTQYLPEEIVREILKRLPVKSLIRFQRVCKQWKNLIKSPPFIADHLRHSAQQNASLLLRQNGTCEALRLFYIDCDMHVHQVQNPPLIGYLSVARIIGSSNGLVCLLIKKCNYSFSFSKSLLLLWNPATAEIRQIPRTKTSLWDCIGFGFNSVVDDYQIVKIYNGCEDIRGVEVYSLRTGSWKGIEFATLKGIVLDGDPITVNGSIFWVGFKKKEDDVIEYILISFDIVKEVITLIPRPRQYLTSKLTLYEDKVAMFCLHRIDDPANRFDMCSFDLLVLEEGTGLSASAERWRLIKKFTTNPSSYTYPLTIWGNEIVCDSNEGFRESEKYEEKLSLHFINVITNECYRRWFPEYNRRWVPEDHFGAVTNYVESLVPIGNIHFEEPLS